MSSIWNDTELLVEQLMGPRSLITQVVHTTVDVFIVAAVLMLLATSLYFTTSLVRRAYTRCLQRRWNVDQ